MKKYAYILVAVVIVVIAVTSFNKKDNSDIVFGFIAPLSGDAALYGETEKNAASMAVEEINAQGGIDGRQVSIIYEDGKCNGKDAVNAGQKLIGIDKVKVILGGACSGETLAVAPLAEQNKVLLFSAFSSNPTITNAGDYVFRNSPSDNDVGKLDADTLSRMYKKVALVTENIDGALGSHNVMVEYLKDNGVEIVSDENYGGSDKTVTDFRSILSKIKLINPEALYINAQAPKSAGNILRQAREIGLTIPIYANLNLAAKEAWDIAGENIEGVVVSDASALTLKGNELVKKYKEKFGEEPENLLEVAASYDRVYIMKQAIEAVGFDANKIKDYLYSMPDYAGALGTYHFDQNGDVVGVGFANYRIENGEKVLIDELK